MGNGLQRGKLDKAGLIQILEVLCEELEKNNLLPNMTQDADAKKDFIDGVADKIEEACGNDLGSLDINFKDDPEGVNNLMNTFKVVIVAEFIKNEEVNPKANPDFKLDPKKLLEDKSELKPDELIKDLKEELHQTITSVNKPKPKLGEKDIDKIADVLAEDLAESMKKLGKGRGADNKSSIEVAAELTIASLFGGKGPTQSVLGNLAGLIDFNPGGGDALNYMAKQNTAEPGKADPTGAEKITLVNAISQGGLSEGLENTLDHIIHPSPTLGIKK